MSAPNDYPKMALSILGGAIVGVTSAWATNNQAPIMSLIMAGLVPVGQYLLGYGQKNPRNTATAEQLLESVKASDLAPAVKAAVAPALARETATPSPLTAMGLPLTDQQVAAKQLYQTQRADLEALEVQRVARARLEPAEPVKSPDVDVDTLLATIETARAALAAKRAQLEAQERRLNTGLAPTSTEGAPK